MKRDDDITEENDVLVPEWYCKSTNDTGQNIKKLSSTIELVVLMNQSKEALVHCLSNHFSSWNQFGIELVKNVLEIVSLD